MEIANEETGDLTILRSKTSDKLEVDNDYPPEGALLTVIRLLYSCFIVLSFILFTSPRVQVINGVSLDSTMNLTVLGDLNLYGDLTVKNETSDSIALLTGGNKKAASKKGSNWKNSVTSNSYWKSTKQTADYHNTNNPSILAVPALFGKPMNQNRIIAPLLVLDLDACHPFEVSFPDHKEWVRNLPHSTQSYKHQTKQYDEESSVGLLESMKEWIISYLRFDNPEEPLTSHSRLQSKKQGIESDAKQFHTHSALYSGPPTWYALVSRGNCPFDVKILNAELAGFGGIIIHNRIAKHMGGVDVPVRMSPNKLGNQVNDIRAMFATQHDGDKLVFSALERVSTLPKHILDDLYDEPIIKNLNGGIVGVPLIVSLELDVWPVDGWGSTGAGGLKMRRRVFNAISFIGNLLFFVGVFMAFGGICTAFCLLAMMIRNYFIHGRMFVLVFAPAITFPSFWSRRAGVTEEEIPLEEGVLPKDEEELEQITLPLHIIESEDLEDEEDRGSSALSASVVVNETEDSSILIKRKRSTATGGTRKCCAICIDEFVVGSRVRELPCHHQFHTECVDPWLLRHNRLCPICKRDVLVVKKSESQRHQVVATTSNPSPNASGGTWWVFSRNWSRSS
ncbi:hypothetical protein BDR26DRAFT_1003391 [Obelidium mucronatum]|nr:hypothetical protein BDR26DRAFT_1003391 [Obelidium mucronatum]